MNPTSDPLGLSDPLRNPERLTAAQIGEGYRTLTVDERVQLIPCEYVSVDKTRWHKLLCGRENLDSWTLRCPIHPPTGTPSDAESILGPQRPMTPVERAALDSFTSSELHPSGDLGKLKPKASHICPTCKERMDLVCDQTGSNDFYHCFKCERSPLTSLESALTDEVLKLRAENAQLLSDIKETARQLEAATKALNVARAALITVIDGREDDDSQHHGWVAGEISYGELREALAAIRAINAARQPASTPQDSQP